MITKADKISGVIVAAGSGTRMGGISKPLIRIGDKTLFEYVLDAFMLSDVSEIAVVCSEENISALKELATNSAKPIEFVLGGSTRSRSAENGIRATEGSVVCVHDCARPFVTAEMINTVSAEAKLCGCAAACKKVTDTVRYIDPSGKTFTPPRENLILLETPQAFLRELYFKALDKFSEEAFTDETSLLERYGTATKHIIFDGNNMKLTTKTDIAVASAIANEKRR